jgi:hypothetical protein
VARYTSRHAGHAICCAWIGTRDDVRKSIVAYDSEVGGFESASLQVNFGMIGQADAERSMTLFAR